MELPPAACILGMCIVFFCPPSQTPLQLVPGCGALLRHPRCSNVTTWSLPVMALCFLGPFSSCQGRWQTKHATYKICMYGAFLSGGMAQNDLTTKNIGFFPHYFYTTMGICRGCLLDGQEYVGLLISGMCDDTGLWREETGAPGAEKPLLSLYTGCVYPWFPIPGGGSREAADNCYYIMNGRVRKLMLQLFAGSSLLWRRLYKETRLGEEALRQCLSLYSWRAFDVSFSDGLHRACLPPYGPPTKKARRSTLSLWVTVSHWVYLYSRPGTDGYFRLRLSVVYYYGEGCIQVYMARLLSLPACRLV